MPHLPDPSDAERRREYHITPRYLAGPTATRDPALRPLLDLGWNEVHGELGNIHITAPDQDIRLGYLGAGRHGALWKFTAYSDPFSAPDWLVTFDLATPTEIVRDFTNRLATLYREGADSFLRCGNTALGRLDAATPLAAAGWSHQYRDLDIRFRSPDRLAEVRLHGGPLDHQDEIAGRDARWLTTAGPPGQEWFATASSFTPEHLVAAMNTALADPAPVIRYGDDLHRLPPQATATPVEPTALTPLDVRRALAAKARSTDLPPNAAAPPVLPAQRSAPPPELPRPRRGH